MIMANDSLKELIQESTIFFAALFYLVLLMHPILQYSISLKNNSQLGRVDARFPLLQTSSGGCDPGLHFHLECQEAASAASSGDFSGGILPHTMRDKLRGSPSAVSNLVDSAKRSFSHIIGGGVYYLEGVHVRSMARESELLEHPFECVFGVKTAINRLMDI